MTSKPIKGSRRSGSDDNGRFNRVKGRVREGERKRREEFRQKA
jgi:hypothetical protein